MKRDAQYVGFQVVRSSGRLFLFLHHQAPFFTVYSTVPHEVSNLEPEPGPSPSLSARAPRDPSPLPVPALPPALPPRKTPPVRVVRFSLSRLTSSFAVVVAFSLFLGRRRLLRREQHGDVSASCVHRALPSRRSLRTSTRLPLSTSGMRRRVGPQGKSISKGGVFWVPRRPPPPTASRPPLPPTSRPPRSGRQDTRCPTARPVRRSTRTTRPALQRRSSRSCTFVD